MSDYTSGVMYSASLPAWQRTYFEGVLLETLRTKSIMVPFTVMKEDFTGRQTGRITYTEVFDTAPNWNALAETDIWLTGAHLDSRTVTLDLEIHGDTLKFSDYSEIVQYINSGNLKGLVQNKIGQNQNEMLDILARNAFLSHPYPVYAGGSKTSRALIAATDLFDPDFAELARTHLEEAEIPGVVATEDSDVQTIVCVTTPRVIHDIRVAAGSNWLEVNQYAGGQRKFSGEAGTWGGVRFVRTNRLVLPNHGAVTVQTTLAAPTVPGQGSAATVDSVYSPGQPTSVRFVPVVSVAGLAVGMKVTIHSAAVGNPGDAPVESDGTQETRRIVSIDAPQNRIAFDRPLLKAHAPGDFLTKGIDLHTSIFMGGPAVVYGVGERPTPVVPPKHDDMMMINRYGWRGFLKFQMFRPEFVEVHYTAGSED